VLVQTACPLYFSCRSRWGGGVTTLVSVDAANTSGCVLVCVVRSAVGRDASFSRPLRFFLCFRVSAAFCARALPMVHLQSVCAGTRARALVVFVPSAFARVVRFGRVPISKLLTTFDCATAGGVELPTRCLTRFERRFKSSLRAMWESVRSDDDTPEMM
jgi:hypothetical protein